MSLMLVVGMMVFQQPPPPPPPRAVEEDRYTLVVRAKSFFLQNDKVANVKNRLETELKAVKLLSRTQVEGDNAGWEDWALSISDQRPLDFFRFKEIFSVLPISFYELKIAGTASFEKGTKNVTLDCGKAGMKLKLKNRGKRPNEAAKPPDLLQKIIDGIKAGKVDIRVQGQLSGIEAVASMTLESYEVIEKEEGEAPKEK